MKANKTHISLETAKLLKDCGVKNIKELLKKDDYIVDPYLDKVYPLYSWQEILWEYSEKFLGKSKEWQFYHLGKIGKLLQQKRYDEADLYFRKNCILKEREQ